MVDYELTGMTCGHCKKSVEKIFSENGIIANASLEGKQVTVEKILSETNLTTLRSLLAEEGYTLGNPR